MAAWTQHAEGFTKGAEPVLVPFEVIQRTKEEERMETQIREIEVSGIG